MKNKAVLKNILLYLGFFVLVSGYVFVQELNNLDEIWLYNFSRVLADGMTLYKDISLILTPLFPCICALFLKIFGNELITLRILECLQVAAILFVIYQIMLRLKINKGMSLIFIIGMYYTYLNMFCLDYNWSALLIQLIILYIELSNRDEGLKYNLKRELLLGILAGLTILFKQSSGAIFAFVFIFYKILQVADKKEIKDYIKIAGTRLLGVIIPVIIFVLYLIFSKTLEDFISYAVLGITTFSNKVNYLTLFKSDNYFIRILAVLVPIQILSMFIIYMVSFVKKDLENKEWFKNISVLLVYSVATIFVIVPISDKVHFIIGTMCTVIAIAYSIYTILINLAKKEEKLKKGIKIYFEALSKILFAIVICYSLYLNIGFIQSKEIHTDINHFKYIPINDALYGRIKKLDKFIEEQEAKGRAVYILDSVAAIYMIPLDKYNKNYDMFNRGNLGKDGEKRNNRGLRN